MSDQKPDNRRRVLGATEQEVSIHGVEDTRRTSNIEETEKPKRRRLSVNPNMESEEPNKKYVPAGFVDYWVSMGGNRPEHLYDQDWDFVLDNDGNKIFREAQKRGTDRHQQVYMMKPEELYKGDSKKLAKLRDDNLKRKAEPDDPNLKKDPFFHDLGITQTEERPN